MSESRGVSGGDRFFSAAPAAGAEARPRAMENLVENFLDRHGPQLNALAQQVSNTAGVVSETVQDPERRALIREQVSQWANEQGMTQAVEQVKGVVTSTAQSLRNPHTFREVTDRVEGGMQRLPPGGVDRVRHAARARGITEETVEAGLSKVFDLSQQAAALVLKDEDVEEAALKEEVVSNGAAVIMGDRAQELPDLTTEAQVVGKGLAYTGGLLPSNLRAEAVVAGRNLGLDPVKLLQGAGYSQELSREIVGGAKEAYERKMSERELARLRGEDPEPEDSDSSSSESVVDPEDDLIRPPVRSNQEAPPPVEKETHHNKRRIAIIVGLVAAPLIALIGSGFAVYCYGPSRLFNLLNARFSLR